MFNNIFRPKLIDTLREYSWAKFGNDALAGLIVGIVALPLAIAFGIASGVSPERGLITAIVAGFLISALGGSRVQIGGPTGAFIVIVYAIVQKYDVDGLIIATFLAGFMLIGMGFARLGSIIKFIPHSLIIGFTSGIAVVIFSSQIRDFLGLNIEKVPADFIDKLIVAYKHIGSFNLYAFGIACFTIITIVLFPRITTKIPGSLIAILVTTIAVQVFKLPVDTIGSHFGEIKSNIPMPVVPKVSVQIIKDMLQPAFAIAMLGAIESLLSAVVADGMIGGNHRSNTELIAQGVANIGSSVFGGIPATGAIARTATNVKNNGRTPVAGMVHALVLLLILVFLGNLATKIPMSCLAGVLAVVSYNMSEYRNFINILKGPKGDVAVMLTTFFLTVLVDLTVAIQIGIVLAAFSFIQKMVQSSNVRFMDGEISDKEFDNDIMKKRVEIPEGVRVFEITGPMFFGASFKLREAIRQMEKLPSILIIRMRYVSVIDATGIHSFDTIAHELHNKGTKIILSELVSEQVREELNKARILFLIGKGNIFTSFSQSIHHAEQLLLQQKQKSVTIDSEM